MNAAAAITFNPEQSHTLRILRHCAQKNKPRNYALQSFPWRVSRDFGDDEIEVAIDILHYSPPDKRHYSGCDYDPGTVELGDAWYLDGTCCKLTPLEREAAEEAATKEMCG